MGKFLKSVGAQYVATVLVTAGAFATLKGAEKIGRWGHKKFSEFRKEFKRKMAVRKIKKQVEQKEKEAALAGAH